METQGGEGGGTDWGCETKEGGEGGRERESFTDKVEW